MKRVLLTGASGAVGTRLRQMLKRIEHRWIRYSTGNDEHPYRVFTDRNRG